MYYKFYSYYVWFNKKKTAGIGPLPRVNSSKYNIHKYDKTGKTESAKFPNRILLLVLWKWLGYKVVLLLHNGVLNRGFVPRFFSFPTCFFLTF